uniref:Uncharacterized protein n=1 Tax=Octopus bimaculoides TaxID=37653 RepID=A0A0L8G9G5_OCTBM
MFSVLVPLNQKQQTNKYKIFKFQCKSIDLEKKTNHKSHSFKIKLRFCFISFLN